MYVTNKVKAIGVHPLYSLNFLLKQAAALKKSARAIRKILSQMFIGLGGCFSAAGGAL